jgi:hypothetical protein
MLPRSPVILAVLALAGGCGGAEDEKPRATATPEAKGAFIEEADAICAAMRAEQLEISGRAAQTTTGQAEAIREIADVHRRGMDRLAELEPPADFEAFDRFIAAVRDSAAQLDRAAKAIQQGRIEEGRSLVEAVRAPVQEAVAPVRAYGLDCGAAP